LQPNLPTTTLDDDSVKGGDDRMSEIEQSGFSHFDQWLALVRRTRELLDAAIDDGELPAGGADYLADLTLPHLEAVQAGFLGWLRADTAGLAELRYLLSLVGTARIQPATSGPDRRAADAEAEMERSLAASGARPPAQLRGAEPWDLAALSHARLVLAFLPRVPDEDVRYPAGRRTYADIPAPRGPAELANRLEELERQLWRTASGRTPNPGDQSFRRAYGFFDAADRLGLRAFRGAA
jgi:hypothetical protein